MRVYYNATILAGKDLKPLRDAYIVVKDKWILDIASGPVPTSERIDLNGGLVIPAFVNAHTHMADAAFKDAAIGLPTEQAVSPPHSLKYRYLASLTRSDLIAVLRNALDEFCKNGIAVFADFREGGVNGVLALREVSKDYPLLGVIFGELAERPGSQGFLQELQEILKHADGVGIGDIADFGCSELDTLRKLLGKEKMLAAHVAETQQAQLKCVQRWRKSEVERVLECNPSLLIHLTNPLPRDLDLVAEAQVPVVVCLRTNCILGDGIPPLYEMVKRGIPIALGTDNFMFTSPNMFREMDWFSRVLRGQSRSANAVSAKQVLSIATLGGAQALGVDQEIGVLEPGKLASFIVIDINSVNLRGTKNLHAAIVHRAEPEDIMLVVLGGKEVYYGRKYAGSRLKC